MGVLLPEEIWVQILQTGLRIGQLGHRDICAMALVCKRLNSISELDCVWNELLLQNFPDAPTRASTGSLHKSETEKACCKNLYRTRYEKVKERSMAAHRRKVFRAQSSLSVLHRQTLRVQGILQTERVKLLSAQKELELLERTSRTSIALQIWQPQAVSARHEQVVQQVPTDLAARKNSLRGEVQVCRCRIQCAENILKSTKGDIERRQSELAGLTYNPTLDLTSKKEVVRREDGKKRKLAGLTAKLY